MTSSLPHTPDHQDLTRALDQRLEFMRFSPADRAMVRQISDLIERELPKGLDKFYAQVEQTPEARRFFGGQAHMSKAKSAQQGHWKNISNADFNADYAKKVWTIGATHARIGLEPRWYIGGYSVVLEHLVVKAVEELSAKPGLFRAPRMTAGDIGKTVAGLVKAVLLDMDLAISVYIEEAERAKQKAQAEAVAAERDLVKRVFGQAMAAMADKNVGYRITEEVPEAYEQLKADFNGALAQLSHDIGEITAGAVHINASADEIRTAADDLSRRTSQQASALEQTAAALEEISTTVQESSARASDAGERVSKTRSRATASRKVVSDTVDAMHAIEESSAKINSIIDVIDHIAFQTNLLALNAGVEAARAGEAGKGFAVVAQEVRELAQRSASAAKEIHALLTASYAQVSNGTNLVTQTGKALEDMFNDVFEIDHHIAAIVASARNQATALREISLAVNDIDQGTQQNAAMVEQTNAATRALAGEAGRINAMLSSFRTSAGIRMQGMSRAA